VNAYSPNRSFWTALAGVPLLFVGIGLLQVRIDDHTQGYSQEREELVLRSDALWKKLSLGYDPLLADIYWTRAVQYYGERVGVPGANFDLLWPLLDITTTLDPKLMVAYRFGSIFLSEPDLAGAGRTDLAIELVKRGIAANPGEWRLDTDLGFLYYWRLKDYPRAAAAYLEGSKNPQAPVEVKMMAARIAAKGGSIDTSRIIWSELYESTKDPNIRKNAMKQLQALKAQEDEMQLDELSAQYRERFGRFPSSTRDLKNTGMVNGIPVDPAGYPYAIGPDGKSRLDARTTIVIPPAPKTPPDSPK
jgi:hypothetical protein